MSKQVTVLLAVVVVILLVLVFAVLAHLTWRLMCRFVDRPARETKPKPPA